MGAIEVRRSVGTPRSKRGAGSKLREPAEDVDAWLEAISPANTQTARREHAFRHLMLQARQDPQPLLDRWDVLAHLLRTRKAFSLYPTVHILAALVPADSRGRFERNFSAYFALLDDEAISVAAHVAQLAGGIALARPKLQRRIIRRLLATDRSHFDAERRGLLGSYALQSLEAIYGQLPTPRPILGFARRLLQSPSPRARKAAKSFLRMHDRA